MARRKRSRSHTVRSIPSSTRRADAAATQNTKRPFAEPPVESLVEIDLEWGRLLQEAS